MASSLEESPSEEATLCYNDSGDTLAYITCRFVGK